MDPIAPIVKEQTPDKDGQTYQSAANVIAERLGNEPRQVYYVVADGYENAISVDGEYMIYEEYRGASRRSYDRYRKANRFECHLLRKIEGLNKFFVE